MDTSTSAARDEPEGVAKGPRGDLVRSARNYALFLLALLTSSLVREVDNGALLQAIVWLPTGTAVAGLWLLGYRAWWVVALFGALFRTMNGYAPHVIALGSAGAAAEALLGAWMLRRLSVSGAFARLRDVLGLVVAAAVAPLASMAFSGVARALTDPALRPPLLSGWNGWWRMNALGLLIVVPLASLWLEQRAARRRSTLELTALVALTLALVWLLLLEVGATSIALLLLYVVLPISLYAALRFGPRGAITTAGLAALLIAVATAEGLGPFAALSIPERHGALQLFDFSVVAVPLVFGALIAERESAERSLALQAAVLEQVATGRPSDEVLRSLLAGIERLTHTGLGSVLFLEGRRLCNGIAPSLPPEFGANVEGLEIGPEVGSCGTAAYTGRTVISADIASDPRWRSAATLALAHGLRACWSVPIRDRTGTVIGTFAIYHPEPRTPSTGELALVERAAALAGIAIERERLEEHLRQAQKMEAVGRLAGGVAHDFNNLLTAISGYAELLLDELPQGGRAQHEARAILGAADRAASLTRQLLAYSRQQVLAPQRHRLAQVVDELGALLRRLIGEHIRLSIEHGDPEACVRVDRGQLEQVVLNLALNARDAMPTGGTLTIRTAPADLDGEALRGHPEAVPGRYVCLSVEDTGVGMDELTRQRAFDPFFTTKELGKGTGLGLSTVYGILRQSRGLVELRSTPGVGTLMSVYLPRDETPLDQPPAALPARTLERAGGTVLLVEDEALVREIAAAALRSAGFALLEAENGERALEVFRGSAAPIDLLVTDLVMPRMGGRELAVQLRREQPGLRVLLLSGYTSEEPPPNDPDADFLRKPFTREQLLERVTRLLGARA